MLINGLAFILQLLMKKQDNMLRLWIAIPKITCNIISTILENLTNL